MARRTLRRTSQLRGRTRRGRVRPRLGSHGCAAADGLRTCAAPRARRRVPTVPGGAARIGRTGGLGGSSFRHAARRRSFPGSFPGSYRSSFCRGSLPTLALARGYLAKITSWNSPGTKIAPGCRGLT